MCSSDLLPAAESSAPAAGFAARDWPSYLGDQARTHYSTLTRINRQNVGRLQVAWTFDTGTKGEYQSNNLIVDGVLYTAAPDRKIIALDAATGRERWRFDPASEHNETMGRRQRGVMYWASGEDRRLFTPGATRLYCLDARTGKEIGRAHV